MVVLGLSLTTFDSQHNAHISVSHAAYIYEYTFSNFGHCRSPQHANVPATWGQQSNFAKPYKTIPMTHVPVEHHESSNTAMHRSTAILRDRAGMGFKQTNMHRQPPKMAHTP
uniref:Uncharacterized protein n=1 Tax=Eutreptiella gymnastica TaxID=73025 RepID=A0A7S4FQM5_9EUGL